MSSIVTQLRVGSWFLDYKADPETQVFWQVEEIVKVKDVLGVSFRGGASWTSDPDVVPNTPDVLRKIGFIKQELPPNYAGGHHAYKICIMPSANRWLMIVFGGLAHIMEHDNIFSVAPCGQVHGLHDIQNLYQSLTGKELEFNLND